jgi:SNF2 family DNA or RNA helicase
MEFKAHNYQKFAINHILEHSAAGLFLDMGLGKTAIALTAFQDLIFLGDIHKILIIAPLRVAQSTWNTEKLKWDHLHNLTISKVLGSPAQRIKAMRADTDIYITNRENVVWLVDHYFNTWPFDACIIDELSSFKSSSAKRFRALKKVTPYFKKIVGLTGTPAPNGLIDLWPQLYLLDRGARLGKTMKEYKETFFRPGQTSGYIVYNWILRDGAEDDIYKKIEDICVSMKGADYLELPERIDNIIKVKLPQAAANKYKALETDLILQYDNEDVVAANAAVLTNKLLQMANGAVYTEDHEVIEIHDEKLHALLDLIEAANGNPILIFYNFKHDLMRIQKFLMGKNLTSMQLKTPEDIDEWNAGKINILLAHPAAVGHGLNLQAGGNIIIWYGLTWSLELYQQANARLHRQGQTKTVIINHIITEGTVDEDVIKAINKKEINQSLLIAAIRARI